MSNNKKVYKIYKMTSPSGKCYIGYTKNTIKERFRQHVNCWKNSTESKRKINSKLYHAFNKYNPDKWTIEEIVNTKEYEEVCIMEDYFINIFDSIENGYNIIRGGHGGKGKKLTEEHKKKLSIARKIYYKTERGKNHLQKISEKMKNPNKKLYVKKYNTDEERKKAKSEKTKKMWQDGVFDNRPPPTKEQIRKQKEARLGKKQTENQKKTTQRKLSQKWKITHPCGKIEIVEILKEWTTKMGMNHRNAQSNLCRGSYRGYKCEKIN